MICNRCYIDTDAFYKSQRCCKSCTKAKNLATKLKDPERRKEVCLNWYYNHKEQAYRISRNWKQSNKAYVLEYERQRQKRPHNLAKCLAKTRKRREAILASSVVFTQEDSIKVYNKFSHKCFNCNSRDNLCIDHHKPLSKGYGLAHNNAVILCRSCNSKKSNKMPNKFYSIDQLRLLNSILGLEN